MSASTHSARRSARFASRPTSPPGQTSARPGPSISPPTLSVSPDANRRRSPTSRPSNQPGQSDARSSPRSWTRPPAARTSARIAPFDARVVVGGLTAGRRARWGARGRRGATFRSAGRRRRACKGRTDAGVFDCCVPDFLRTVDDFIGEAQETDPVVPPDVARMRRRRDADAIGGSRAEGDQRALCAAPDPASATAKHRASSTPGIMTGEFPRRLAGAATIYVAQATSEGVWRNVPQGLIARTGDRCGR